MISNVRKKLVKIVKGYRPVIKYIKQFLQLYLQQFFLMTLLPIEYKILVIKKENFGLPLHTKCGNSIIRSYATLYCSYNIGCW